MKLRWNRPKSYPNNHPSVRIVFFQGIGGISGTELLSSGPLSKPEQRKENRKYVQCSATRSMSGLHGVTSSAAGKLWLRCWLRNWIEHHLHVWNNALCAMDSSFRPTTPITYLQGRIMHSRTGRHKQLWCPGRPGALTPFWLKYIPMALMLTRFDLRHRFRIWSRNAALGWRVFLLGGGGWSLFHNLFCLSAKWFFWFRFVIFSCQRQVAEGHFLAHKIYGSVFNIGEPKKDGLFARTLGALIQVTEQDRFPLEMHIQFRVRFGNKPETFDNGLLHGKQSCFPKSSGSQIWHVTGWCAGPVEFGQVVFKEYLWIHLPWKKRDRLRFSWDSTFGNAPRPQSTWNTLFSNEQMTRKRSMCVSHTWALVLLDGS